MDLKDCKILICDDSILTRKQLKDVFHSIGCFNCVEASNGKMAVDMYKEHQPDIVFLDIIMPELDGIEAVKQIISYNPDACIIMVSSVGTQAHIKNAIEEGAKDFVQKPFTVHQIISILKNRMEVK